MLFSCKYYSFLKIICLSLLYIYKHIPRKLLFIITQITGQYCLPLLWSVSSYSVKRFVCFLSYQSYRSCSTSYSVTWFAAIQNLDIEAKTRFITRQYKIVCIHLVNFILLQSSDKGQIHAKDKNYEKITWN